MCCQNSGLHNLNNPAKCLCHCNSNETFLSRKKRLEALKQNLAELEAKADDLREFIKELETAK